VDGIELQDGTRPTHEILVSMPQSPASGSDLVWLAFIYTLRAPLEPDDTLEIVAGLPKTARPDISITYVVECPHGKDPEHPPQWGASGRDRRPIRTRLPLNRCAGTREIRLVIARTPGPDPIQAIWATAIIRPHP
jgi:hypothetical protein